MRYAPLLVLVLLATGLASCDSTKPENPLTESETVALLREIVLLFEDEIEGSSSPWIKGSRGKIACAWRTRCTSGPGCAGMADLGVCGSDLRL